MEILLVVTVGAMCIGCFLVGARVGQKVSKGESLELPSVNPIKAVKEHNEKKEAEAEAERYAVIMGNIERYDGTSRGQEDVE